MNELAKFIFLLCKTSATDNFLAEISAYGDITKRSANKLNSPHLTYSKATSCEDSRLISAACVQRKVAEIAPNALSLD